MQVIWFRNHKLNLLKNIMKRTSLTFVIFLMVLAGCTTTHQDVSATSTSETVLVTYRVQSGKEAEFEKLLKHGWEVYQQDHLVSANPHVVVKETENGNKAEYVEIFTWIKSPDHPPDDVKAVWQQEQSLCEARGGKTGIEIEEVERVK